MGVSLGGQNFGGDLFFASLILFLMVVTFQRKQDPHSRLLLRKSNVTFAEQKTTMVKNCVSCLAFNPTF